MSTGASPSRAAVSGVPGDAVRKLFLTSTHRGFHDGQAVPKQAVAVNMHSIRERKHIPPRAATAPEGHFQESGGAPWRGTEYTRKHDWKPNSDYELNCFSNKALALQPAKQAPDVVADKSSSYGAQFRYYGNRPVAALCYSDDNPLNQLICAGDKATGLSQTKSSYCAPRKNAPPQPFGEEVNLGGVPMTYDFLNSTYGVDFRSTTQRRLRSRARQKTVSQVSLADIAAGPLEDAKSLYQKSLLRSTSQKYYVNQGL
mmetsp:Transcript_53121/g.95308  ORF Transcript_53121/g.95308 Transcript_53121/m.95308 type:complete len:257 (-) Transcript_53121:112-882(-)|eukprot:CAMPEP_0197659434 /NCGR_PEP_ID=MMETSP1338-20131121/47624_1 /TAXON_ID=43686 ORGANISM="Pelagodinium beii, Strain RCC1491" /NCGR_SAMPLE_ID=MMETSP1338 /ASSEMBLY_ACC=CAM_ASM_000754 /LENGTH=256 /DNA_ID=CAMNT_0043236355 /DNA_START=65 /DNA_END=835 /DNA_ORIENTATION=-